MIDKVSAAINEERFRSLAETAHNAILFTDGSGSVAFWNRAAEEMFGYRSAEMVGQPLSTIVPPRLREAHERGVKRALSGSLPVSGKTTEITGLRRDGSEFPLELTLARWESGDGTFLTAIARDITSRRRADAELRESEERYRSLFEESPVALWEQDCTELREHFDELRSRGVADIRRHFEEHPGETLLCLGRIRTLDVNKAALEMYGASCKEDLLDGPEVIICEESRAAFRDALVSLAEGQRVFEEESVTRTLKGRKNSVYLRWVAVPGPGGALSRLLLSITDLTAHRKLEDQLIQSQKMEAVGRLAGGVAHDFNNLLSAITINTDLLLRELDGKSLGWEAASIIGKTAEEAGKIVHQLLSLSRRQELKLEVLDLNASISKLNQLFPHILGSGVKHLIDLDENLSPVRAQPGQIEQIVLNLVVNARDAMPRGGSLSIVTENVVLGRQEARLLTDLDPGPYITLTVTDSGDGIEPGTLEHIFEPFFTTRDSGSGLGLSTVYSIVRQLGGHIGAGSIPGMGASFIIYLPAAVEGAPGAEA